jgi:hypothetical protein
MGSIFEKVCCGDKSALITTENITSHLTSPCRAYLKGIQTPERKVIQNPFAESLNSTAEKTLKLNEQSSFRRSLTSVNKNPIDCPQESSSELGNMKKTFRRTYSFKEAKRATFLQRAKKRMMTLKEQKRGKNKYPECFGSFCIQDEEKHESYIIQPDGDWVDTELD